MMCETFRNPAFFPRHAMIRRATLQRFCPQGKQRRTRTPAAPLAHRGKAASPNAPQAAGPCSWACRRLLPPPPHPNRNAARPPPARGAGARLHGAEGFGCRHCRLGLWAFGRVTLCPTGAKRAAPALKMLGRLLFFPYISFLMSCMPFLFAVSILRASHFSLFRVYRRKEVSGLGGSTAGT